MANQYQISTIQNLVDIATDENIDCLLADLKNFIEITKNIQNTPGMSTTGACFEWIDDGKNDVIVLIVPDK